MTVLPEKKEITSSGDEYCVAYHGFTQTHIDSLCHLFYKGRMYNGFSQDQVTERGAAKLSIVNFKQGILNVRGILMDMPKLLGVRFLEGGRAIYPLNYSSSVKYRRPVIRSRRVLPATGTSGLRLRRFLR